MKKRERARKSQERDDAAHCILALEVEERGERRGRVAARGARALAERRQRATARPQCGEPRDLGALLRPDRGFARALALQRRDLGAQRRVVFDVALRGRAERVDAPAAVGSRSGLLCKIELSRSCGGAGGRGDKSVVLFC